MKPRVLIISRSPYDHRVISQAGVANGCSVLSFSASREIPSHATDADILLAFCDTEIAQDGQLLRRLSARRSMGALLMLIVPPQVKRDVLKSLSPWVHGHIASPVIPEIAGTLIRNSLRMLNLEREEKSRDGSLRLWLDSIEGGMGGFDPLLFNGGASGYELARAVVKSGRERGGAPAFLMIGTPAADGGSLRCDLFSLSQHNVSLHAAGLVLPEPAVLLGIRGDRGFAAVNLASKGRSRNQNTALPPELLQIVGPIKNMVVSFHGGRYIIALNYERRVCNSDALELKGVCLPLVFLGSISDKVRDVSESFLVLAHGLALVADSQGDNGAHVSRMEKYAIALAESLELSDHLVRTIGFSARLHDVGKIYIHPDLLEKPLRLTQREFELIKKHPVLGVRMLGQSPLLETARRIALTHHECWDGTGYPQRLTGNAIPIEGAIVKISDVYDALRTMHAYKSSLSHADACEMILCGGGDGFHETRPAHFHPDVIRAFRRASGHFEEVYAIS